jgi:hypothetical protein
VAKGFSQIQGQDYDEMFATVVSFDSLHLLLSIVAANGFVLQELVFIAAFLYGALIETIYMHLSDGYWDDNTVAYLMRCIFGLQSVT